MEILITEASVKDIPGILEIEDACFGTEKFSRRQFVYLITKAKGKFFIAKYCDKIVAYVSLITNSQYKRARIYSIAVHPDARKKNLGKALLQKSIEYVFLQNIYIISLEVKTTNIPAISLYESYGFENKNIIHNYYEDASDAFRMELNLLDSR